MEDTTVEILLIKDNINDEELAIRALLKSTINNNLLHLKNGVDAHEFLFETGKFKNRDISYTPKVILLDFKKPKVDGLEVLTLIKSNELTKKNSVLVLTSFKEHLDIERAYAPGDNSYIAKPVEFEEFTKAIAGLGFHWLMMNQAHN